MSGRARSLLFDAGLALVFTALSLLAFLTLPGRDGQDPLVLVLLVIHSASLFWRRRLPLVILAIVMATGLAVIILGYPTVVLGPTALVAVYTAAANSPRRHSIPAAAVSVPVAGVITASSGSDVGTVIGNVLIVVVVWFLGDTIRQRRDYVRRLEQRTAELEQARDELARAAVVEERLHIARELHDIIGHTVGAIAVQAGVGAHVIESNPTAAKDSLVRIESISKSALNEIRQLVGALRETEAGAEVEPLPGLDALPALVDRLGGASVHMDLQVDADAERIPPGLQLTIYRVVQEALTNVVRHAGATSARVTIRTGPADVRVEVIDDGIGAAELEGGHGLNGMKERVSVHGGSLEYGSLPEKGFRICATLPLGGA